jgi:hypothetical protein
VVDTLKNESCLGNFKLKTRDRVMVVNEMSKCNGFELPGSISGC